MTPGAKSYVGSKLTLCVWEIFYLENIGITKIIQKGEHFVYRGGARIGAEETSPD